MQFENQISENLALCPIQTICPISSLKEKSWSKIYRAQCMIPFHNYSIKLIYFIAFMGFKIYVRIDFFLVPMVFPSAFPICQDTSKQIPELGQQDGQIPLASYSFNWIYCARCTLGLKCNSHVPGFENTQFWRSN